MAITKITPENVKKVLTMNMKELHTLVTAMQLQDKKLRKVQLGIIVDAFSARDLYMKPNLFFITVPFKVDLEELMAE